MHPRAKYVDEEGANVPNWAKLAEEVEEFFCGDVEAVQVVRIEIHAMPSWDTNLKFFTNRALYKRCMLAMVV